jgi:hypothetical protein
MRLLRLRGVWTRPVTPCQPLAAVAVGRPRGVGCIESLSDDQMTAHVALFPSLIRSRVENER